MTIPTDTSDLQTCAQYCWNREEGYIQDIEDMQLPPCVMACVQHVLPEACGEFDEERKEDEHRTQCQGQTWTCEDCGNTNYGYRMVCNMRNCRKLKPKRLLDCPIPKDAWVCANCGNVNFSTRTVCNMRKCRFPRYHQSM